jgi:multidrug/hemolysin transport system permease protein
MIFIKRNLKLYFRDKSAVFFSLLSVFIIIALYAVFLGDAWMSGSMKQIENARELMNDWLIAGLLSVASVTTTMGAFGVMIDDKTRKIDKDFYSSPIKRSKITSDICSNQWTD